MKPTAAQQMMIDDGLPVVFILSSQERHALWEANPPRNPKPFVDPRLEQDRQLREEEKKHKAQIRIQKMKAGLVKKATTPFSTKGLRWDTRYSKWVPDGSGAAISSNTTTQEDLMPRLIVTPYDVNGLVVERGKTSVKEDATQEQIDAQIRHAIKRGGAKVVRVEVTKDGEIVSNIEADKVPAAIETTAPEAAQGADAQPAPEGQSEEEADMAKKRKSAKGKKSSKTKAEKGYKDHRAGSRKEKAHKLYDELGPEKAKPKVIALGIKAGSVNGWFSSFKKK